MKMRAEGPGSMCVAMVRRPVARDARRTESTLGKAFSLVSRLARDVTQYQAECGLAELRVPGVSDTTTRLLTYHGYEVCHG